MIPYVIDASVAGKWFTQEDNAEDARRLLNVSYEFHTPDFFLLEMDSIFCKWIRRGVISKTDADEAREALRQTPVKTYPFEKLRDSAYSLANQTTCSLYDCLYLCLAIRLNAQMVTADRRLCDALADGPLAEHVLWVGDVALNQNPHQTAGESQT